jgi:ubiquinone biosynthesis UbiH/UbiF/VisC/COQ6 family hydroxylase
MHDFSRTAIVCRMAHEKPHQQTAMECFHYGRTLAVLPMTGNLSSVVITVSADAQNEVMDMDEALFNLDIQQRLDGYLGAMTLVGKRHMYPLVAVHARKFSATRFALIGDAAVGMHPVTAHGFNLGLSGQDILATEIKLAQAAGRDIGAREVLDRYQNKHMRATRPMYLGTNGIVTLFTNDTFPARVLRKLVLHLGNELPLVKQMITSKLTETGAPLEWLPQLPRLLPPFPPRFHRG